MNEPLDIILKSVREVEWRTLKDCLGFIDYNIADILNNLIDDDPHKRNIAYWKLDNHIVIQGGISESCFYILPFLNELVTITNNRLELLNIIFEIFNGNDKNAQGEHIIIKYNTEIEPFEYFIPISVGREAPLLPSIITYMEANKSVYLKLLNDISSVEELETLLYIILCFKRDPFIKECVYSAKNNDKNNTYDEIFEGFIADIEEVHSL
ncbi:hypothetical protein JMN12_00105 [Capnocytophaga genosp. AHN8471]|uniref:hypothetical protein n=1 Tax=Capnocytophaga genosp. AHN8471 TaxID=327574 RepID=UPI0019319C9C|nr:hypothetical protein [Capnocytophaga genosp. AHN8471]MBM0654977.1 hypothetical protein [Capnocytophaga genosp. AHN8471]